MKLFVILLLMQPIHSQLSVDPKIFLNFTLDDETTANSLCQSLMDTIDSKQGTRDILLARIDENIENSVVGDLSKCMGTENPVVLADLKNPINNNGLRKAKLIIVEGLDIDLSKISSLGQRFFDASVWNHMANILFISHTTMHQDSVDMILYQTSRSGFLNVALMHKINGSFEITYAEKIMTEADSSKVKTSNAKDGFFPDKFKNSSGYPIHIPVFNQRPFLSIKSGVVVGKMTQFVEILEQKMNAIATYHIIKDFSQVPGYARQRMVHLTLNKLRLPLYAPRILTYEENGFCALVPTPPKLSVTELIFIKPFDQFVWILLGLTVIACLVTWRLFLNRGTFDSFWLLMFGMFAMFVGQSIEFRRTHRVVLVILLQLIVSMIFVLSNGYQGVITSFMIQPERENRFRTVKELLDSDLRILISDHFAGIVKDSVEFQAVKSKVDILNAMLGTTDENDNFLIKSANKKSVMIIQCDYVRFFLDRYVKEKTSYYKLPQKIITTYGHLAVGSNNPFVQKFQHLMDLSFEAGLPQAWPLFLSSKNHEDIQVSHELKNLGLNDLSQIFYFLIFGCICAAIVFLVEMFFREFIDKLDLSYYTSKLRNYINELGKLKKKKRTEVKHKKNVLDNARRCCKKSKRPKVDKPKVRRILVQPVDSVV